MASALDYLSNLAPTALDFFNRRGAANSVANTQVGGVNAAAALATSTGARLQGLYDTSQAAQQKTLADAYAAQQATLSGALTDQNARLDANQAGSTTRLDANTAAENARLAANSAQQQQMLDPYRQAGQTDLDAIQAGVAPGGEFGAYDKTFSFTGKDLPSDPGYQFALDQGNKQLDATRRAMGTKFSGGAVKEAIGYGTDYANTKFNDAFARSKTTFDSNENTFRQNQTDRYSRLKGVADMGLTATGEAVNASLANTQAGTQISQNNTQVGAQLGQADIAARLQASQQNAAAGVQASQANAAQSVAAGQNYESLSGQTGLITSQQLQNLEAEKANAIAAGDVSKANTISDTIETATKALQQMGGAAAGAKSLLSNGAKLGGLASAAGPLSTAAGAGLAAAGLGTGTSLAGAAGAGISAAGSTGAAVGLAPTLPGMAVGGAGAAAGGSALTGYAGGGLVTSHGALIGMATNPITIGVAAAIVGVTALLKSQAHWEANTWVQGFQNKFDANMGQLNTQFGQAASSGQLTKADAQAIRDEAAAAMKGYEEQRVKFAAGGKDNKKVAGQALDTFNQAYGADGSKMLNWMDGVIKGLA